MLEMRGLNSSNSSHRPLFKILSVVCAHGTGRAMHMVHEWPFLAIATLMALGTSRAIKMACEQPFLAIATLMGDLVLSPNYSKVHFLALIIY